MKSKILKIVLGLILFSVLFITVSSAATTVKEDVQDYDDIVYIIGSTRFDSDVIITAQRAANAGVSEAKRLVAMGKADEIENLNLKTYCYIPDFDEWYEIQEEAKSLTKEEIKNIEENLNIFFVNNKEKILKFNYNANKDDINIITNGVTFDGKKFSVPATKTEFKFLENNVEAIVKTKTNTQNKEELDYGNFEIKYNPVVSFKMPTEFIVGKVAEFSVTTTANSYQGTMIVGTGGISGSTAIQKLEYYEVKDGKWYEMPTNGQFGVNTGFPLSDATSKFRVTFKTAGDYEVTFAIKNVETNEIMASAITKANVKSDKTIAKVGQNYYEDLAKAVKDATDSTVVLLQDTTITERLNITNNVTLDLGGHTINIEGTNNKIAAQQNANVTIKNGNVIRNTNYGLQSQDNAILNIAKDLNIKVSGTDGNAEQYGVTIFHKATLNFEGNITVEKTGAFACGISGNGNEPKTTNTTVNILGGSIKVEEGVAIYHPQVGKLNIKDGTLEANTTLGIKSGEIDISGGTLKATGAKNDADAMPENIKLTGDTVYIEQNTAYYGHVSVNITGGQLISANGYIMQEFNPTIGTEKERNAVVTGNYETRTILENNVTIFTETSEAALETAKGVKYTIENFADIIDNPTLSGGKVTLLKNLDNPSGSYITSKVTLDLGGKKIDKSSILLIVKENGELTLKNGTMNIVSDSDPMVQVEGKGILNLEKDLTINATSYGVTIFEEATVNSEGTINATGKEAYAISGNADYSINATVNILDGKINAPEGHALYLPLVGTTTISGGKLTANTVVGIKAGTLNITGGELIATGTKVEVPSPTYNGVDPTGDAVFVELNNSYSGNVVVNYTAGKVTSENAYVLREYSVNGQNATINGLVDMAGEDNIRIFDFPQ